MDGWPRLIELIDHLTAAIYTGNGNICMRRPSHRMVKATKRCILQAQTRNRSGPAGPGIQLKKPREKSSHLAGAHKMFIILMRM